MKKAFTLIEVLVAVFVFLLIFLIATTFVNLAAGQTRSSQTRNLTLDLRNTMEILNQKMNNANATTKLNNDVALPINGFRYNASKDVLGIASSDGNCVFIGRVPPDASGNLGYLAMRTNTCTAKGWANANKDDLNQRLTPISINVTGFSLSGDYMQNKTPDAAPFIKIIIEAQDSDPKYQDNKIKLETAYSMDYQTLKLIASQL